MKAARAALAAAALASCSRDAPPAIPAVPPAPAAVPAPAPAPPPREGVLREGAPAPELTAGTFGTFTRKRSPEVRRCYEAALAKDPTLRGKVTIAFAIQPGGGVSDVRVARTTFRSSAVPSCVAAVVRGWRTPFRPDEPVDVEYPIDFGPR